MRTQHYGREPILDGRISGGRAVDQIHAARAAPVALFFLCVLKFTIAHATGTANVMVPCAGVAYSIPKEYIQYYRPGQEGAEGFNLLLTLPSLHPLSKATAPILLSNNALNKVLLVIRCDSTTTLVKSHARIEQIIHDSFHLTDDQFTVAEGGLWHYRGPNKLAGDLYVGPSNGEQTLFLECRGDGAVPYPTCTVIERWTKQVIASYYFDKHYKGDAVRLDGELRSLLASFLVAPRGDGK